MRRLALLLFAFAFPAFADLPGGESTADGMREKLKRVILPQVDFVGADLKDALGFLHARSATLDPDGRGVGFILRAPVKVGDTQITLHRTNASLFSVLEALAGTANCEVLPEPFAVVLTPKGAKYRHRLWTDEGESAQKEKSRLHAIRVPMVHYEGTPLTEAVQALSERAKKWDPQGQGADLYLRIPEEVAAKSHADLWLADLPLDELLRYWCESGGLQMRIHAKGVDIFAAREPLGSRAKAFTDHAGPWPRPTNDDVRIFLERNGETAGNFAAAFAGTGEASWLEQGLKKFPKEPLLLLSACSNAKLPAEKRGLIESMKTAESESAVPWILAAALAFEEKHADDAAKELKIGLQKQSFHFHYQERTEALRRLMMESGEEPLEAEMYALVGAYLGPFSELLKIAKGLEDLHKKNGGEEEVRLGWDLATLAAKSDISQLIISEIVCLALEKIVLRSLPEDARRDWLPKTPAERSKEMEERKQLIGKSTGHSDWLDAAAEPEIAREFIRRFRADGELAAQQWLATKRPAEGK